MEYNSLHVTLAMNHNRPALNLWANFLSIPYPYISKQLQVDFCPRGMGWSGRGPLRSPPTRARSKRVDPTRKIKKKKKNGGSSLTSGSPLPIVIQDSDIANLIFNFIHNLWLSSQLVVPLNHKFFLHKNHHYHN